MPRTGTVLISLVICLQLLTIYSIARINTERPLNAMESSMSPGITHTALAGVADRVPPGHLPCDRGCITEILEDVVAGLEARWVAPETSRSAADSSSGRTTERWDASAMQTGEATEEPFGDIGAFQSALSVVETAQQRGSWSTADELMLRDLFLRLDWRQRTAVEQQLFAAFQPPLDEQ